MPFPCLGFRGNQRLWTKEKVLEGLAKAAQEIQGVLPCRDRDYNLIKKGRLDWPCSHRVLEYFGSMARGWLAAGVARKRVTLSNIDWEEDEIGYLLDKAGTMTLADIATRLRRSYGACKRELYKFGVTARANQGFYSAAEISKLYDCPYHRVRQLLSALITANIKSDYVFISHKGHPLDGRGIYCIVHKLMREAGIQGPKLGPHRIRHAFGKGYLVSGGDIRSLQQMMGHAKITTTEKYAALTLKDITAKHHKFTPLRAAHAAAQEALFKDEAIKEAEAIINNNTRR